MIPGCGSLPSTSVRTTLGARDMLEYLPGSTTDHPSQRDEQAYAAAGVMLRSLHDATAGHGLAGVQECVVHGNPGPYNTLFQNGMPTAFIDWDSAAPGTRLCDLAYAALTWCLASAGNVAVEDQARRMRLLTDGYGGMDAGALLRQIEACQDTITSTARGLLEQPGRTIEYYQHQRDAIAWAQADRSLLGLHRVLFLKFLA